ncbi:unnamed protein product, partial [Sphagnum balticum]
MRCVSKSDELIKPFELLKTGAALEEQIKTRDVGGQKHSVESWNFEHHDHVVLFVLSGKDQITGKRINRVNFEISEMGKWQKQKHETWNVWDLMIKLNFSELKFLEIGSVQYFFSSRSFEQLFQDMGPEEKFLFWWFLFTSEEALAPDMINTRGFNWIIFL